MPKSTIARDFRDVTLIFSRAANAVKENVANHPHKTKFSKQPNRETMSERMFVRAFGDKVKKYRLSNRADFVGLMILGREQGFLITQDGGHNRKIRLIDIENGVSKVTHRYLQLKDNQSVSNLQRGLLKWVR